jgi:protein-S-isoprenylcysteine O-methyltransferase Ste14
MARVLPLLVLVVFGVVSFGWRSWFHARRYGHSGLVLFRSGRWMQHLRESLLLLLSAVLFVQAVIVAVAPNLLAPIAIGHPTPAGAGALLGTAVVFIGLTILVTAQLDMGASWRVGVDTAARPGLITGGLYRFSRNPIYAGMFVSLAGFVLLLPTWITVAVTAMSVAGIRNQVREEERYLRSAYGDAFTAYARRVGRFVPRLGTLD